MAEHFIALELLAIALALLLFALPEFVIVAGEMCFAKAELFFAEALDLFAKGELSIVFGATYSFSMICMDGCLKAAILSGLSYVN